MDSGKMYGMVRVFEESKPGRRYVGVGCDEEGAPEYLIFDTCEDADAWEEMFGGFPEGVDVDFVDNGHFCSNCGRWIPNPTIGTYDYWIDYQHGEVTCKDCLRSNPAWARDYVETCKNNPKMANTLLPDAMLQGMGWHEMEEGYENGWYGIEDDPVKIMERLNNRGLDVVFSITDVNPFATRFSAWTRKHEEEED